jgi:restriction system protein
VLSRRATRRPPPRASQRSRGRRRPACEHVDVSEEQKSAILPSEVAGTFVRQAELAELLAWWEERPSQPAVVTGRFGDGKSSVLEALGREVTGRLGDPHSVRFVSMGALRPMSAEQLIDGLPSNGRALIVLDDVDVASPRPLVEVVETVRMRAPQAAVAIAAQSADALPQGWIRVQLEPIDLEQTTAVVNGVAGAGRQADAAELLRASEGLPRLVRALADQLRDESLSDVLALLHDQHFAPVYPGPPQFPPSDRYPGTSQPVERELDVRVSDVSEELIRRLAARPELLYELTPRKFEELMAEIFERQGFEVRLTKQTRDGGYDLYLVQHTAAGSVLTLADMKRYRSDRKIGVGVVRELYGTVEKERASAGLLATTSFFTAGARQYQEELPFRLELKDYFDLVSLLRASERR